MGGSEPVAPGGSPFPPSRRRHPSMWRQAVATPNRSLPPSPAQSHLVAPVLGHFVTFPDRLAGTLAPPGVGFPDIGDRSDRWILATGFPAPVAVSPTQSHLVKVEFGVREHVRGFPKRDISCRSFRRKAASFDRSGAQASIGVINEATCRLLGKRGPARALQKRPSPTRSNQWRSRGAWLGSWGRAVPAPVAVSRTLSKQGTWIGRKFEGGAAATALPERCNDCSRVSNRDEIHGHF
jgi:hypothetical protein